jgi:hypothetical protein
MTLHYPNGRFPALPDIVTLEWKNLPEPNTLAYHDPLNILVTLSSVVNVIKWHYKTFYGWNLQISAIS